MVYQKAVPRMGTSFLSEERFSSISYWGFYFRFYVGENGDIYFNLNSLLIFHGEISTNEQSLKVHYRLLRPVTTCNTPVSSFEFFIIMPNGQSTKWLTIIPKPVESRSFWGNTRELGAIAWILILVEDIFKAMYLSAGIIWSKNFHSLCRMSTLENQFFRRVSYEHLAVSNLFYFIHRIIRSKLQITLSICLFLKVLRKNQFVN